ncbi:MAG: adenylyl-sulfate kinase [Bacteroidia bacterium]|nr:adenylyl-sulfate kinase [Bacteroidia bacterium]
MVENIHPIFDQIISREEKESFLKQKSVVLWLTGLSGSGKSTLAKALERKLQDAGFFSKLLDGDNIRSGLNNNLGFSLEDRKENIRRISEAAKLFLDGGMVTICSFVSPTREIRDMAREIIGDQDFLEVYVNAPLEVCEARDVKGLYKKARAGEIKGFTGIDSPFEAPENPFAEIRTHEEELEISAEKLFTLVKEKVNFQ